MSADFGGITFARVKKEIIEKLSGIENIIFYNDSYDCSNGGIIDGYDRKTLMIETKKCSYYYVVDNELFSGFVSADRMVVQDKEKDTRSTYKLSIKDVTINPIEYSDLNEKYSMLSACDYIYPGSFSFDCYVDKTTILIPRIWISKDGSSQKKNSIIVEVTLNDVSHYIIFNIDEDDVLEVSYFDNGYGELKTMSLETISENEYLDAFKKADEASMIPWESGNYDEYCFPVKIQFDFIEFKIDNEYIKDDETNEKIRKLCKEATNPYSHKNALAEYKDGTLILNGPYDHVSEYLIRTIIKSIDVKEENIKLVISKNIKYLGDQYFDFQKSLNYFFNNSISEIDVDSENEFFYAASNNKAIVEKNTRKLVFIFDDVYIPEGIKIIGRDVFSCQYGDKLIIPEGVEIIEDGSFYGCSYFEVDFPESLIEIGKNAFQCCDLKKIVFPKGLKRIGSGSFCECNRLMNVEIGADTIVEEGAFRDTTFIENSHNFSTEEASSTEKPNYELLDDIIDF